MRPGLGKLNVMSALGEPLKAEVELVAEKNESGHWPCAWPVRRHSSARACPIRRLIADVKVSTRKACRRRALCAAHVDPAGHRAFCRPADRIDLVLRPHQPRIYCAARSALRHRGTREAEGRRSRSACSSASSRSRNRSPFPSRPRKPRRLSLSQPNRPAAPAHRSSPPLATRRGQSGHRRQHRCRETIGGSQPTLLGEGSSMPTMRPRPPMPTARSRAAIRWAKSPVRPSQPKSASSRCWCCWYGTIRMRFPART